jgi:hypothetical protein
MRKEGFGLADRISPFNRYLLFLISLLYVISLGAFTYANWMVEPDHVLWMHAVNALILSLPLILFYGSAYVLVAAWREHTQTGSVSPRLAKTFHWASRLAAFGIIFFVSLFSLDVFDMEGTPLELLGAFIMHNLPSIFMIFLLVVAWRRPVVGFMAFLIVGLFFLLVAVMNRSLGHFLLFAGPLLLISGLFYADWRWHQPQPPAPVDAAA